MWNYCKYCSRKDKNQNTFLMNTDNEDHKIHFTPSNMLTEKNLVLDSNINDSLHYVKKVKKSVSDEIIQENKQSR